MASAPGLPIDDVADDGRTHTIAAGDRCPALGVGDATDLIDIRPGELGEAAPSHVHRMRHHLHVIRIDASPVSAEVIDLQSIGDGAISSLPIHTMGAPTNVVNGDHAVSVDINHSLPLVTSGLGGDGVIVFSPRVPVDESPALTSDDWILSGSPAARPDANFPSASALTKTFAHGYSSPQWQVEYTITKGCVS